MFTLSFQGSGLYSMQREVTTVLYIVNVLIKLYCYNSLYNNYNNTNTVMISYIIL